MRSCLTRNVSQASHLRKEETLRCGIAERGRGEGRGEGQETHHCVRATLSSAEVPPGCVVTQPSLRFYPKQRPPWEKHMQLLLFFHFNVIIIN